MRKETNTQVNIYWRYIWYIQIYPDPNTLTRKEMCISREVYANTDDLWFL
jgi:hypothetical protein